MELLICCRRNDDLERNNEAIPLGNLYQVPKEHIAKQKEFFVAIQNINVEKIKEFADDEEFDIKEAKESPSKKEAFHFLAELEKDATGSEEDNTKDIFQLMLDAGCQINATDRFGNTPLMLAAEKENRKVLTLLLANGAETEKTNDDKNGPLHWASKKGRKESIELLLQYKANINAQNKDFETPLHLAVREYKKDATRLLIDEGADTKLVDLKNHSPSEYAARLESKSMEELFRKTSPSGKVWVDGCVNERKLNGWKDGRQLDKKTPFIGFVKSLTYSESDEYGKVYNELYQGIDLEKVNPSEPARILSQSLGLIKHSMEDPPKEAVKKCRYFCSRFKKIKRRDIIKELRTLIPAGMTGPLAECDEAVIDMDSSMRQKLTRALCGQESWKLLANQLGISSNDQLSYYDKRERDPAEAILREECKNRDLKIEELYNILVECDAEALADKYL